MNPYKRDHIKWGIELKKLFHNLQGDVPYCEMCNTTQPPLDIAHSRKRFDIHTKLQYFHAAMLCRKHHNFVEQGRTHLEMYNLVKNVIDSSYRDWDSE